MQYYLLVCQTLTHAQGMLRLFERAGISAWLMRTPKDLQIAGCSFAVKIRQKDLSASLLLIKRFHLPYLGIYLTLPQFGYEEVFP